MASCVFHSCRPKGKYTVSSSDRLMRITASLQVSRAPEHKGRHLIPPQDHPEHPSLTPNLIGNYCRIDEKLKKGIGCQACDLQSYALIPFIAWKESYGTIDKVNWATVIDALSEGGISYSLREGYQLLSERCNLQDIKDIEAAAAMKRNTSRVRSAGHKDFIAPSWVKREGDSMDHMDRYGLECNVQWTSCLRRLMLSHRLG